MNDMTTMNGKITKKLSNKLKKLCGRAGEYLGGHPFFKDILTLAAVSVVFVYIQAVIQNQSSAASELSMLVFPVLMLCNALPIFVLAAAVYCLTRRVWIGALAAAVPLDILLCVNYFKVHFRAETLSIHDFSLVSEVTNIMGGYTFPIPVSLIFGTLLFAAVIFILKRFVKVNRVSVKARAGLFAVSAAVFAAAFFTVYGGTAIYNALPSFANIYDDTSVSANKGFLFTFLTHTSSYEYTAPDGYSEDAVYEFAGGDPAADTEDVADTNDTPVNIIAIMSEAFFDMEECGNARWYDGMNPTPCLDRLKNDSLWGHILVPGFAGSTASTEFEFLTGMNISLIDSAMPVVYKTHVTMPAYSLAQMLKSRGYMTSAFHPGNAWFYNRKSVYPRLGFDKMCFKDELDYDEDDLINYYISDDYTADKIIADYNDYLSEGEKNGYFSFTVTIQNHGPYSSEEPEQKRLINDGSMDEAGYNILCNYANGLYDADALLGKVCNAVEDAAEPTVVVFFGDHLPFFDAEGKYLSALGLDVLSDTAEALENRYSTPYIIHGNAAFDKLASGSDTAGKNGRGENISSSFLACELLSYAGISQSNYFKAVGNVEKKITEISDYFYIAGGVHTNTLTDEQNAVLNKYDMLCYWGLREFGK